MVQATSEKFGVHVGNMKFNTQNEETVSIHIIIRIIFIHLRDVTTECGANSILDSDASNLPRNIEIPLLTDAANYHR